MEIVFPLEEVRKFVNQNNINSLNNNFNQMFNNNQMCNNNNQMCNNNNQMFNNNQMCNNNNQMCNNNQMFNNNNQMLNNNQMFNNNNQMFNNNNQMFNNNNQMLNNNNQNSNNINQMVNNNNQIFINNGMMNMNMINQMNINSNGMPNNNAMLNFNSINNNNNNFIGMLNQMNPMMYMFYMNMTKKITDNKNITLNDCFSFYKNKETVFEGNNLMQCHNCHIMAKAIQKNTLYSLPDVLIINLNRGKENKYDVNITFPEELDLQNEVETKIDNQHYKLICLVTHLGPSGPSGHYISFCWVNKHQKWFQFNDSSISESSFNEASKTGKVYILFYERQQPNQINNYN
jgi:ubiquitin C-terminal hydrolase